MTDKTFCASHKQCANAKGCYRTPTPEECAQIERHPNGISWIDRCERFERRPSLLEYVVTTAKEEGRRGNYVTMRQMLQDYNEKYGLEKGPLENENNSSQPQPHS